MKKIYSTALSILMLFSFAFTPLFAQENRDDEITSTTEEETTEDNVETTTIDRDEETTTSEDTTDTEKTTVSNPEGTIGIDEDSGETTESDTVAPTTTKSTSSTSFLEGIDTMWLWVILGVGGVILIGSLIGIVSLSKKEKKDKKEEVPVEESKPATLPKQPVAQPIPAEPVVETPQPTVEPTPVEQPIVEPEPVQPEPTPAIEPTPAPSIKETLGEASTYQEPQTEEQIVSNIAPTADLEKDMADLNIASPQPVVEPQSSTIEATPITPSIAPEPTPTPESVETTPQVVNVVETVPLQAEIPPQQQSVQPESPAPMEVDLTTNSIPENNSMHTPQNPEPVQPVQNNPTEGFNQPIDTTNL